jgi:hypothetical protein
MTRKNITYKAEHRLDQPIRHVLEDDDIYLDKLQTREVEKSILSQCET